jgi:prepilin-type N-terminal cleavage/methylation domain-containing protein/prepilin-type processing-associated H-X9-DG protein
VRRAFTLVELLVVIAIIGVLVALLLPAIQAAREAARRTQCSNNLKNIGLSFLNYESSTKEFPTGGAGDNDRLECYAERGKPWVGKKQGMSWAYQLLPYLEQGALHDIGVTSVVQNVPVALYNCPSRRGPTLYDNPSDSPDAGPSYLMDYAGAQPATSQSAYNLGSRYVPTRDYTNCDRVHMAFWGNSFHRPDKGGLYDGVIVRSPWARDTSSAYPAACGPNPAPGNFLLDVPNPTRLSQISDGTSNTLVIGEKYVYFEYYQGGKPDGGADPSDDKGWLDGWDPDTMRSTMAVPLSDSTAKELCATQQFGQSYMFGSAHSAGFNCVFADGSVHTINYDVPIDLLNSLGTKGGEAGPYEVFDLTGLN